MEDKFIIASLIQAASSIMNDNDDRKLFDKAIHKNTADENKVVKKTLKNLLEECRSTTSESSHKCDYILSMLSSVSREINNKEGAWYKDGPDRKVWTSHHR